MGVTALAMDVITEKSGHQVTPCAVSVCTTPAAPSPLPIPYPVLATAAEGLSDTALRTKVTGSPVATVGSVFKGCHGNEPGTLKEVVSLNTAGPCFIIMGAPVVLCELGMMGITGSACISNKAPTPGANGTASGAGGAGGGGGGGGGGGAAPAGPGGPSGPSNGGGGGGGSNSGAGGGAAGPGSRAAGADAPPGTSSGPPEQHQCTGGHPVDLVTGDVVDNATDIALPGRIPLRFTRSYSSARRADRTASLGPGWANDFEQHIHAAGERITFRRGDGRTTTFAAVPVGESTFHRRERLTLYRDGEQDFRVFSHDTRRVFTFRPQVANGRAELVSITDAWQNTIAFHYEGGRLDTVTDTAGRVVVLRWRSNRITRVEVTVGGFAEDWFDYEYDDDGRLIAARDALGFADEFEYDGHGRMSAATLATGVRFQYAYDKDSGRCLRTWGPNGRFAMEFEYDEAERRTYVYGEEGGIIDWDDLPGYVRRISMSDGKVLSERAYDEDGYLIALVNGAGEGRKHWYDATGNEVRRVDSSGATQRWEYDAQGCLRRAIEADGTNVTEHAYDDKCARISTRERTGRLIQFAYDALGRLERELDEHGTRTTWQYDAAHCMIAETDARGATIRYAYDALGRAIQNTDELGRVTRVSRDRVGQVTTLSLPDGRNVQRSYDGRGKVVREVAPDGGVTTASYSGMGVLDRLVTADGRVWTFSYTSLERISKLTNPLGESHSFTYDEGGRLIAEKTFDERTIHYERTAGGRVSRLTEADGSSRTYEYDRSGNLVRDTGSDGSVVDIRRDIVGRVLEARVTAAGKQHVTLFERDAHGRLVLERQGDWVVRHGWDNQNRRIERSLFDGTTTRYGFDREGSLVDVEHAGKKFHYERDAAGRELRLRDDRSFVARSVVYDELDRMIEQRVSTPTGLDGVPNLLVSRSYRMDAAGRTVGIEDARWGTRTYEYDAAGKLTHTRSAELRQDFSYNLAGSLSGIAEAVKAGAPPRWKLGAGNRLLETERLAFAYDKCARRIEKRDKATKAVTRYTWDVRNRLSEVLHPDGTRVVMSYDAMGRRIRSETFPPRSGSPKVTDFVWDGNVICADMAGGKLRSFVHHPVSLELQLQAERGQVFMVVSDGVGVPRELIDAAGRVAWAADLDVWGSIRREQRDTELEQGTDPLSCPFRLLGQYADADTGLTSTRFRMFDPEVGRWLSPDPIGLRGGFDLNGFNGAPTVNVDPFGLADVEHKPSRNAAMAAAQEHAQVPRQSKGGTPIEADALNADSRGDNWNKLNIDESNKKAKLKGKGEKDPKLPTLGMKGADGSEVFDHPDGHPSPTAGDDPHHELPHVHATNKKGEKKIFTYPDPSGGGGG